MREIGKWGGMVETETFSHALTLLDLLACLSSIKVSWGRRLTGKQAEFSVGGSSARRGAESTAIPPGSCLTLEEKQGQTSDGRDWEEEAIQMRKRTASEEDPANTEKG